MKKKHIMELPTNVPRLKEGKTFEQKLKEGRLRFNMEMDGLVRKKLEAKTKKEKESNFHDDGAVKVTKDLEDAITRKKGNPGKFTGKEYLPAFPTKFKGQNISNVPGLSTKTTKDTIRTYSGKEYQPFSLLNKKKKKEIAI